MSSITVEDNVVPKKRKKARAGGEQQEPSRKESLGGALARALVGTLAFIFRAPVRLFRPVKLSSWNLLEAMAKREGRSLSLRYIRTILKREKSTFFPHLLLPPLLVNTTIGFCLFEVYSLTESSLLAKHYPKRDYNATISDSLMPTEEESPSFTPLWIVAIAGGSAGAAQCIVSAPLDNVRIILSSNIGKNRGHQSSHLRHPLGISWRAVARAAVLPFAPDVTRSKLVDEVAKGGQSKSSKSDAAASKENTRLLWEKRIKRWRGGVHGAGLIMSLARDSVGFSAFFVVFEMSRRLAFKASLGVDRALAMINSSAILPVGQSKREVLDESYRVEGTSPGDVSYSQSRTKIGRSVAALVLVIGGAIGAALYEFVGRPAELMRIVIWEGRKAWEEGRRGKSAEAWSHDIGRSRIIGARRREKVLIESNATEMKKGSFLSLRRGNKNGTTLSRVQSSALQRAFRPSHPLKLNAKAATAKQEAVSIPASSKGRRKRTALRLKHRSMSPSAHTRTPPLETRPSAYTLLLEHAQRTSILRFTSALHRRHRLRPTPVPTPILLFHTYFVAPFSPHTPLEAPASSTSSKSKPATRFRLSNLLYFRYPATNGPGSVKSISQAQVWGTGRFAWALRRLASPYSIGFLAFAWMSGDLA